MDSGEKTASEKLTGNKNRYSGSGHAFICTVLQACAQLEHFQGGNDHSC